MRKLHFYSGPFLFYFFLWIGKTGYPGHCNYNASKAGIIGFTKSAAKELGKFGIRVNCICPGFIQSAGMSSDVSQKVIKQNGLWKDLKGKGPKYK